MAVLGKKIGLVLVAVAITAGTWLGYERWGRSNDAPAAEPSDEPDPRAELLASKHEQHGRRSLDVSPATLGGRVRDADTGAPLAGAMVVLSPVDGTGVVRREAGMPAVRPRVLTDADGRFAIEALPPGGYRVSAAKLGYLPVVTAVTTVAAGHDERSVELGLHAGGHPIEGIVSDIGGGPIAGALVRASSGRDSLAVGDPIGFGTLTDDEGHYAITLPDGTWTITAGGEDYTVEQRRVRIDHGPGRADFSLVPGATIHGRVLDRATGKAVADAMVGFKRVVREGTLTSFDDANPDQIVITDAAGRFRLQPLDHGEYTLFASASGRATLAPTVVQAAIGEQIDEVVVMVDPAFDARGFVVDKGDRERGLAGIRVSALAFDHPAMAFVTTSDDGYFELRGLLPGSYMLSFDGDGVLPSGLEHSLVVEDRAPDDMLIELQRGFEVAGRVDPPMPGQVKVANRKTEGGLEIMMAMLSLSKAEATIGDDGRFEIHNVPAGEWKVVATGEDGSQGEVEIVVADAGPTDVQVSLSPRSKVEGLVLDEAGEPMTGLTVSLLAAVDATASPIPLPGTHEVGSGVTTAEGRFVLWGIEPGQYTLAVRDPAQQSVSIVSGPEKVETTAGDATDVELRVALPHGRIDGTVQGPDGQPLADAWITAVPPAKDEFDGHRRATTTITDADGRFALTGLADVPFDLHVRGSDGDSRGEQLAVRPDGGAVTIELHALGSIRGVVRRGRAPVKRFSVVAGRGEQRVVMSDDGSFSLSRVEPGEQLLRVQDEAGSAHARVVIEPGAEAKVELELGSWGSVTGTVVSVVDGTPLANVSFEASSESGMQVRGRKLVDALTGDDDETDAEGRFSLDGVGEGTVTLYFSAGSVLSRSQPLGRHHFTLEAGQQLDLGTIAVMPPTSADPEQRGTLGFHGRLADPRDDAAGGATSAARGTEVLRVIDVAPAGPAAQAGLVAGDRIVAVDELTEAEHGASILAAALDSGRIEAGRRYSLEIERDGTKQSVSITAAARVRPGRPR